MSQHSIINVEASNYEYSVDLYEERFAGDSELIVEATHVYVLTSRNDAMLELFVERELWGNQAAILSEEGEMLLFCFEELENEQYDLLLVLGIEYDLTVRELVAA